jgi:hypothetical protein
VIGELTYASSWWAWWSNPLKGMHEDFIKLLPLSQNQSPAIDYFSLLQLRSSLSLPDIPDKLLQDRPELRSIALANNEALDRHLMPFGVFTLDSSILHARAQDWESNFGVSSPDTIREIITLKSELPAELGQWQEGVARRLANALKKQLFLNDRAKLGFAIYLRSFYPNLYTRWLLTQSSELGQLADTLDTIPVDLWDVIHTWSEAPVQALHADLFEPFKDPEFEMTFDDDFNEEIAQLDKFSEENDA